MSPKVGFRGSGQETSGDPPTTWLVVGAARRASNISAQGQLSGVRRGAPPWESNWIQPNALKGRHKFGTRNTSQIAPVQAKLSSIFKREKIGLESNLQRPAMLRRLSGDTKMRVTECPANIKVLHSVAFQDKIICPGFLPIKRQYSAHQIERIRAPTCKTALVPGNDSLIGVLRGRSS